jgi:hypothetical protein
MITKAKTYKTRMIHLIKHALKTRQLGDYMDITECSPQEPGVLGNCLSFKIYGEKFNITYWITPREELGGTQYEYVVDNGVWWLNDERRRRR